MDGSLPTLRKLQHGITRDTYCMRFGPPSTRCVRDGEPQGPVFTHHGRPKRVSLPYPVGSAMPVRHDPTHWDPDPLRPDWAYSHRRHFTEEDEQVAVNPLK